MGNGRRQLAGMAEGAGDIWVGYSRVCKKCLGGRGQAFQAKGRTPAKVQRWERQAYLEKWWVFILLFILIVNDRDY